MPKKTEEPQYRVKYDRTWAVTTTKQGEQPGVNGLLSLAPGLVLGQYSWTEHCRQSHVQKQAVISFFSVPQKRLEFDLYIICNSRCNKKTCASFFRTKLGPAPLRHQSVPHLIAGCRCSFALLFSLA